MNTDNFYFETTGRLGTMYAVGSVDHGFLGEFNTFEEVIDAMKTWAEKNNYFPNLYFITDHGNIDETVTYY